MSSPRPALPRLFASRRRVVLVALGFLLALDLGRSVYARIGYAHPSEPWQAAPFDALTWPPGADLASDASLGERVYVERCAVCHGRGGRGNGPAAPSMIPRPRDFTSGEYKYKSTPSGQPPTDADLVRVVARGLGASAMPYWDDVLDDAEIRAVVEYIKRLSDVFDEAPPRPIDVPPRVRPDADSVARGRVLYAQGCRTCHGPDGRANATPGAANETVPVATRDLTAPWTFRGGSAPEQVWMRLSSGMAPGAMPSYADGWTPEERWDVVSYVASLARTPPWAPAGVLDGPGHADDLARRGEYLVHAEMCGLCHTHVNADMIYSGQDYYLAGGMGIPIYPHAVFVSRNLTSDPETGLGGWTEQEVAHAIRNGRTPERGLNLWGMPWQFLHSFEPDDALAIATYLKRLPPVTNQIPPPLRYGLVETVVAKVALSTGLPPIGNPRALTYKAGNYGRTVPGEWSRDWPQKGLINAQWVVLVAGIIAFAMAGPGDRRWPRGFRGWAVLGAGLVCAAVISTAGWVLYETPVLGFVPPEAIGSGVAASIPTPDPDGFENAEQAALAERGRYLYTVTSCAFCHGDGSGGNSVSMRSFGTVWVRNISSDPETGIGAWSDAEIARAIRSGVSRDGGPLHWQGMVWDHLSNLDEEDVRALIVYLRTLPPISKRVPAPHPPSADDCPEYTFHLFDSMEPGCQ